MKTLFFSIVASLLLSLPVEAQTKSDAPADSQRIHIKFGRPSKQCKGFGICEFTIDFTISEFIDVVQAFNNMNKLQIKMTPQTVTRNRTSLANNVLLIEEDFTVPAATSRALGFGSYTIKKGKYPVVFDSKTNTYNCTFN